MSIRNFFLLTTFPCFQHLKSNSFFIESIELSINFQFSREKKTESNLNSDPNRLEMRFFSLCFFSSSLFLLILSFDFVAYSNVASTGSSFGSVMCSTNTFQLNRFVSNEVERISELFFLRLFFHLHVR